MKTTDMSFDEALVAMKQGYKVRRKAWKIKENVMCISDNKLLYDITVATSNVDNLNSDEIMATDWEVCGSVPDITFEIGEMVMVRAENNFEWYPAHFARKIGDMYQMMTGDQYRYCAKMDKNILFTTNPVK